MLILLYDWLSHTTYEFGWRCDVSLSRGLGGLTSLFLSELPDSATRVEVRWMVRSALCVEPFVDLRLWYHCWVVQRFRRSSHRVLNNHKSERHHILTKNLKTLCVIWPMKCSTFIFQLFVLVTLIFFFNF